MPEGTKHYADSGVMFINQKKNPKAPDFRGRAEIICPHCHVESPWEVASWMKQGKAGKFFSLSFKQRDEQERPNVKGSEYTPGGQSKESFPWED